MRKLKYILFLSVIFVFMLPLSVFAKGSLKYDAHKQGDRSLTVPDGYYLFNGDWNITPSLKGAKEDINYGSWLLKKKSTIKKEVKEICSKRDFSDTTLSGDLQQVTPDGKLSGEYFWNGYDTMGDLEEFFNSKETDSYIVFTLNTGVKYYIFVPRGLWIEEIKSDDGVKEVKHEINRDRIPYLCNAILTWKHAVNIGVLAGSIERGYNIYNAYTTEQSYIDSVMTEKTINTGTDSEQKYYAFNSNAIKYGFQYFYHPLFGKISPADLPKTDEAWKTNKEKCIKYTPNIVDKKLELVFDNSYMAFSRLKSVENDFIKEMDSSQITNKDGAKAYKDIDKSIDGKQTEISNPLSAVDFSMRVMMPSKFARKLDNTYALKADGFSGIARLRVSVATNNIYIESPKEYDSTTDLKVKGELNKDVEDILNEGGDNDTKGEGDIVLDETELKDVETMYKKVGKLSDFGIARTDLAFFYYTDIKGNKLGAVIPLKYKEAIFNTTSNVQNSPVYMTGREVLLGENYSGAIDFLKESSDVFGVYTKTTGKKGALVRDFAFAINSDPRLEDSHVSLGANPDEFELEFNFQRTVEYGSGFFMYRNNQYMRDDSLIKWLQSSAASGVSGVKAKELLDILVNAFTVDNAPITYENWLKMQGIKKNLAGSGVTFLKSVVNVTFIIVGTLSIVLGFLLVIAYFIDIFNVFTNKSIIELLSRGRLYPVASKASIEFSNCSNSDTKYIDFWGILILFTVLIVIGMLMILSKVLLVGLMKVYLVVNKLIGGI